MTATTAPTTADAIARRAGSPLPIGPDAREWLARSIGVRSRDLDIVRMKGSTSSSVYLVQCTLNHAFARFALRVLDNSAWLADEPDLAEHEAAALEEARHAGLRAPRLVAYASDDTGFGAPVVLMTFLEGEIDLPRLGNRPAGLQPSIEDPADVQRWLAGLACELAAIHRHDAPRFGWHYRSWVPHAMLKPPRRASARVWERAIDRASGPAPAARPVFIHRDYHPTNVLWRGGAVSGVVDWINACRGPAGVDVAHCRTNLAMMYGGELADRFLAAYRAIAEGFTYDPYWDIDSLLDCSLPQPTFYPPWLDFGLDAIPQSVLNRRVDAYLESVMARVEEGVGP